MKARTVEVESRDTNLAVAMRQNTGIARPVRPDLMVKPEGAAGQGPKPQRRCASRHPGDVPSRKGNRPLNPPNRRIRTRTYGGVEGEELRGSPYPDFRRGVHRGPSVDALAVWAVVSQFQSRTDTERLWR